VRVKGEIRGVGHGMVEVEVEAGVSGKVVGLKRRGELAGEAREARETEEAREAGEAGKPEKLEKLEKLGSQRS
jgi:hypothetical protein